MNWRVVLGNLGTMLRLFSLSLLVPLVVSLVYEPWTDPTGLGFSLPATSDAFLFPFALTLLAGVLLERLGLAVEFRDREAYVLVGIGWIACTAVAAIPYVISGVLPNPVDAFFEAMSGITTTGASLITMDYGAVPASVHVWRGLTQWIGGMGIVVLSVAVLARLASAGARLMQAELPGGKVDRVRPSIKQTARSLWKVYSSLSAALFVILVVLFLREGLAFPTAVLDAMVHTFTTLSTGGFSTQGSSIEAYNAPLVELAILVFMVLAGTNFALTYRAVRGRPGALFRDAEFRFFLTILAVGTAVITAALLFTPLEAKAWEAHGGRSFLTALRLAAFQATSIITTTGYSTANFDAWPELARFLLLFFMFVGGCTGSTSGSIKVARVLILFRLLKAELRRISHPRAVLPVRVGHDVIDSRTIQRVAVFIFAYLTAFIAGTVLLLALEPVSVLDGASAVAASLGNIGPGLGVVGPASDYAAFSDPATVLLSLLMWFGRLELFAVLVLFTPETYQ